jgi:hypothetical protein
VIFSNKPDKTGFQAVLVGWTALLLVAACGGGGSGSTPGSGGVKWSGLPPSGTYPESIPSGHAAAFDSQRNRTVIAWGEHAGDLISEVWDLTLTADDKVVWEKLLPGGKEFPQPRAGHSAVYDPVAKRVLLFGGKAGGQSLREVWEIGFQNGGQGAWRKLSPTGNEPASREGHTAVFDELNDRMVFFGGWDGGATYYQDVWELGFDLSEQGAWVKLSPGDGPAARAEHSVIIDPGGNRMIVFGGRDASGEFNDTWEFNWSGGFPIWKEWTIDGAVPPARSGHAAVFDPDGNRMIVFGGRSGNQNLNDAWELDLSDPATHVWRELLPAGNETPEIREQHIAVRDESAKAFRMIVYGGFDDTPGTVWLLENRG